MLPLLVPIVSMLAEKGLGLLSKAFDVGSEKVVQLVEEKTGVKLDEKVAKNGLSQEEIIKLQEFQSNYELELARIALSNKQEDNRHTESLVSSEVNDKMNARGSNHLYELQTDIGKRVFVQTSILIPLLILINIFLIAYATELRITTELLMGVSTLIGMALSNAYRERQSMLEFLYGSSVGSKIKELVGAK